MKCFRQRCCVTRFSCFIRGSKHSKTTRTVFSCLDPLMKHSNSLFTYNVTNAKKQELWGNRTSKKNSLGHEERTPQKSGKNGKTWPQVSQKALYKRPQVLTLHGGKGFLQVYIFNNYSPKWRLIVVDINRDAKTINSRATKKCHFENVFHLLILNQ